MSLIFVKLNHFNKTKETLHLCENGKRRVKTFRWDKSKPVRCEVYVECEDKTIVTMHNFEPYYLMIGKCVLDQYSKNDLIKIWHENRGNEINNTMDSSPPDWDGSNKIPMIIGRSGYNWLKYVYVDIKYVSNIFLNDLAGQLLYENASSCDYKAREILEDNIKYLASQEFVSKRASHYEVTSSDIVKILDKLNKQL